MANKKIEQSGLEAVIDHEKKAGRTEISRVQKCGYDLVSKRENGTDERHIEVKATSKSFFTSRWLEPLEYETLNGDPLYFLYLVTDAQSQNPTVWEYDRKKIKSRPSKTIVHYVYAFKKSDFRK